MPWATYHSGGRIERGGESPPPRRTVESPPPSSADNFHGWDQIFRREASHRFAPADRAEAPPLADADGDWAEAFRKAAAA